MDHLNKWRDVQTEAWTDDQMALELERWLAEPQDSAAQMPSEPQNPRPARDAQDGAPAPTDPQGAAPGGVPTEVLTHVQTTIDSWSIDTVKQKLREWSEPVGGSEKVMRLRLVTKLAPEVAKGTEAATALLLMAKADPVTMRTITLTDEGVAALRQLSSEGKPPDLDDPPSTAFLLALPVQRVFSAWNMETGERALILTADVDAAVEQA